jgi:deazaflavin-dependent oxidoreductase (nitroreductase family)
VVTLIALIVGGLLVALAVVGVVIFGGMRRKSPSVLRLVRRFNRVVVNPRVLRTAGTPGASASVIHHVGRTSGHPFRVPVVAEPTTDGFVIALPYGTTANWVKNVLASGAATVVDEGETYEVAQPEIVPLSTMAEHFPAKDLRTFGRFRVDQCLRFRRADASAPPSAVAGGAPPTAAVSLPER